jgi:hypothetical protein
MDATGGRRDPRTLAPRTKKRAQRDARLAIPLTGTTRRRWSMFARYRRPSRQVVAREVTFAYRNQAGSRRRDRAGASPARRCAYGGDSGWPGAAPSSVMIGTKVCPDFSNCSTESQLSNTAMAPFPREKRAVHRPGVATPQRAPAYGAVKASRRAMSRADGPLSGRQPRVMTRAGTGRSLARRAVIGVISSVLMPLCPREKGATAVAAAPPRRRITMP